MLPARLRSPVTLIISASLVVIGGTVWAFTRGEARAGVIIPKELSVEALKAQAADNPGTLRATVRETMRRDDLTDEQRRQVGENMRKVWEETMHKRVDEYYAAASEEEKNEVLDRQIDEFEERRKEWEARRKEEEKKDGKNDEARGGPGRGPFAPQNREERKDRAESRNPDQTARQMAYFSAMRQRMSQRGLTPPSFGPGGRGGLGGPGAGSSPRPKNGP